MSDMTATELASRLGVSRRHAVDLLADGAITGRKLSSGAWLADADSVLRYEASARRGGGRTLDADTAWGLLLELSGLDAAWLTRVGQVVDINAVGDRVGAIGGDGGGPGVAVFVGQDRNAGRGVVVRAGESAGTADDAFRMSKLS